MKSTLSARTDSSMFRLRLFGYDRAEVDEFLRRTEADRRQLQVDLAQLDMVLAKHASERCRELERLAAGRIDTARPYSVNPGHLHTVAQLLSSSRPNGLWLSRLSFIAVRFTPRTRVLGAVAAAIVMLVFFGIQYWSPAGQAAGSGAASTQTALQPIVSRPVAMPEPVAQEVEDLLLTLTAQGACWIRTIIDGNQPLERLLKPNETIALRVKDEVVLKVGDAAALSVMINNKVAKPFGAPGKVVTTLITRSNYQGFLSNN